MPTLTTILSTDCGERIDSREADGSTLVVVSRHNLVDDVAAEVIATADGRFADLTSWHEGDEAEWIAYERIAADGTGSHGFVDSASRKVVQSG